MRLSFVIPAYNEATRIGGCLDSILEETARNQFETEIVVVNNNSTDTTAVIVQTYKNVRLVDEPNKGIVFARQCGMNHSTGELIANIDADCVIPEGWLVHVMAEFTSNPKLVALSGPYIYFDLTKFENALVRFFYYIAYGSYFLTNNVFRIGGMLQGGNFIVRRDAMEKIGGFDTRIAFYGEDTDIAKRIFAAGQVKWTFTLPMHTSGRRLRAEGIITMGLRYAINHLWQILFSKTFTTTYRDIRE